MSAKTLGPMTARIQVKNKNISNNNEQGQYKLRKLANKNKYDPVISNNAKLVVQGQSFLSQKTFYQSPCAYRHFKRQFPYIPKRILCMTNTIVSESLIFFQFSVC